MGRCEEGDILSHSERRLWLGDIHWARVRKKNAGQFSSSFRKQQRERDRSGDGALFGPEGGDEWNRVRALGAFLSYRCTGVRMDVSRTEGGRLIFLSVRHLYPFRRQTRLRETENTSEVSLKSQAGGLAASSKTEGGGGVSTVEKTVGITAYQLDRALFV